MIKENNMSQLDEDTSEIARWFVGKSVLITGATGFMGKVLLEKILYSCPGVKKVYIFLRAKKGRTPNQRIHDMWKLPMFERLKKCHPKSIDKIIPIAGELVTAGLGISVEDRNLLINEVNVVFHMAATLKLEGTLKDAINMNTAGTLRLLELCKEMKNLNALIHLSTAFCNCDIHHMEEKIYNWRDDPHEVIRTVNWIKEEALQDATPKIIHPHPNTYTYSKRLAEILVSEEYPNLPIAVVRPSIVCPSVAEPVAGWVDNLNGPIGLLVGAGKGVIRSMHCEPSYPAHVVPVDFAINGIIVAAYKTAEQNRISKPKDIPVYNMTQHDVKRITFGTILEKGRSIIYEYPFEMCVWYPGGDMRRNKFIHDLYVLFCHIFPAYFIDFLMLIFRQKRFMVRVQTRITQGLELLQFFTTREWLFDSNKFLSLWQDCNKIDKRVFTMDFDKLDTDTYLKICVLGARQYCMKEDLSSLPRCRLKQKFLYALDKAWTLFCIYMLLKLFAIFLTPIQDGFDMIHSIPLGQSSIF